MKKLTNAEVLNDLKFPFYAKISLILIGLYVLFSILYITQDFVVPIIFSAMIAILLHPIVNFFVRLKINRVISIILTLLLTFIASGALAVFMFKQLSQLSDSWPLLVDKFTDVLDEFTRWVSRYFDLSPWKVNKWMLNTKSELLNISTADVSQTLFALGNGLMLFLLIPVYVFMILFYKARLIEFIHIVFGKSDQQNISRIISATKSVIQRYLSGLVIESIIIAILNTSALFALGIEYAILLGVIGALLNVIPYVGGLIAVALPMMVALATKSTGMYAFYVLILYYIIQLIDNNIIVPLIVSSKVKINALFSIIVLFAGNALWGILGMFLSIPLLAVAKVIMENITPLKPWGFLLGDVSTTKTSAINPIIKKIKNKIG
ncbi:MAG: AI-2E family transporter [Flavobacteriales bacterium CG_4_8_14_3_um_filter_35_10]|nr:AI-2E family transporter [Zetaproteobacteria bacterium]OIO10962.1 MAG: AI-2E family transporter [Flavobacteriaceae bacterium CG1_02_35_72]PIX06413.1 MAG: AI-2E family transporter [Flavobacteriales bacterium CG_4_8_14_3_um_filter_35_10]PJA05224.1 MAG: AI-2E family transporter [Flavobacteriales bacterium CG_4_10_14_0_2_um_filter_35_18]